MVSPCPLSVGDFLAAAGLIWQLLQTLRSASEDTEEFQKVQLALSTLHSTLLNLEKVITSGAIISDEQRDQISSVLTRCRAPVVKFDERVKMYITPSTKPDKDGVYNIKGLGRKIRWSFVGKNKIKPFEREILYYVELLGVNMHVLQHPKRARQTIQTLSGQIEALRTEVKTQVVPSPSRKWDQEPICFSDAIGRKYALPIEACRTFKGFLGMLLLAFDGDNPIMEAIKNQAIWLFTRQRGQAKKCDLIWEKEWESYVQPGMALGMSLFSEAAEENAVPVPSIRPEAAPAVYQHAAPGGAKPENEIADEEPGVDDEEADQTTDAHSSEIFISANDVVQFQKPHPEWSEYEPDTEFRVMSERRIFRDIKNEPLIPRTKKGPRSETTSDVCIRCRCHMPRSVYNGALIPPSTGFCGSCFPTFSVNDIRNPYPYPTFSSIPWDYGHNPAYYRKLELPRGTTSERHAGRIRRNVIEGRTIEQNNVDRNPP